MSPRYPAAASDAIESRDSEGGSIVHRLHGPDWVFRHVGCSLHRDKSQRALTRICALPPVSRTRSCAECLRALDGEICVSASASLEAVIFRGITLVGRPYRNGLQLRYLAWR